MSFASDNNDCFMFQYVSNRECANTTCLHYSKQEISSYSVRCLFFNADVIATQSVSQMIKKYFAELHDNFHCKRCSVVMNQNNVIISSPIIICISFSGIPIDCEFEPVIIVKDETYDLLSVIYLIGRHFRCRFNIDKIPYEYDGMIKDGEFKILEESNPFTGIIKDEMGTVVMFAVAMFYTKRETK